MATYQDLKSVAYLPQIVQFVREFLGLNLRPSGDKKFSAHCPFHRDTTDSFRVRVDDKGEVRFHCFGKCAEDWDVYDLIRKSKRCSFREAQNIFAKFVCEEDFKFYAQAKDKQPSSAPAEKPVQLEAAPHVSAALVHPVEIDPEVTRALNVAADFYHRFLREHRDRYPMVMRYLVKRGLSQEIIDRFQIGFSPPFKDEELQGRALLLAHLDEFMEDYLSFRNYVLGGLFRNLNDETGPWGNYFHRFIEFGKKVGVYGHYADFFAGKLTFPIRNLHGDVHGFVGRSLDNRGIRWLKQKTEESTLYPKGWLYGIDQAARYIRQHKTVIIVEGIFDYFAFYKLLQDQDRPFIVSTMGTTLTDEAKAILLSLGAEHFVVAYDCDPAGRQAIEKIAGEVGGGVYFLDDMDEGEDPAEKLLNVANSINAFSVSHLTKAAKRIQKQTSKPVFVSHIPVGRPGSEILFQHASTLQGNALPLPPGKTPEMPQEFIFDVDDLLPLLTYDHVNKAALGAKLQSIIGLLNQRPLSSKTEQSFRVPVNFIDGELYQEMGTALILWLRILIEQQRTKKRVRKTDSELAGWLKTSRATVSRYKAMLSDLGYLKLDTEARLQKLSVVFFPKGKVRG